MNIKKIHIIVNPSSGKQKQPILPVLNEVFTPAGVEWDISIIKKTGDAAKFAKEAIKNKVDCVAVYGGDGTIRKVLPGMVNTNMPLAIFPGGTANVMSKELGIPQDLKAACEMLCNQPQIRTLDAGRFKKHHFILRVGLGLEADMVKGAPREKKNRLGVLAYATAAATAIKEAQEVIYDVTIDGEKHQVSGFTCIIANSGHLGLAGLKLDKKIDVGDGVLDVIIGRHINLKLFAHTLPALIKHELPNNTEVVAHWQGKNIVISPSPLQAIQCDGRILKSQYALDITVLPQAMKILVPKIEETKKEP